MIQTEMSCEYEDFIGTYRNVFPDGFCRHVIDCFEDISQNSKWVISRQQENKNTKKHDKDDKLVFLNDTNISKCIFQNGEIRSSEDVMERIANNV